MSPVLTIITPGGGRPEAMKLLESYVKRQSVWGKIEIEWLVVNDDKKNPIECNLGQKQIYGDLNWSPGVNTLRYNLDAGLKAATGEHIAILENDDYFRETYLEVYLNLLKYADIVGGADVVYYSLRTRGFREMKNYQHSSTTQTIFRRSYLPWFYRALHSGEQYFDILLFNQARQRNHKYILFSGMHLCVGMKGLPGRSGIGVGHQDNEFIRDNTEFTKLKELLGPKDAEPYIDLMREK